MLFRRIFQTAAIAFVSSALGSAAPSYRELVQRHRAVERRSVDDTKCARIKAFCEVLLQESAAPIAFSELLGAAHLKISADSLAEMGIFSMQPQLSAVLAAARRLPDGVLQQEVVSAAKYSEIIGVRASEDVLLMTTYAGRSVPGFDGVVLNARGVPVANLSLKYSKYESVGKSLDVAIERAARYSSAEQWLPWEPHSPIAWNHGRRINNDELEHRFRAAIQWLKPLQSELGISVLPLLGVAKDVVRPSRVVVEIADASRARFMARSKEFFDGVRNKILRSQGRVESVTFILGDGNFEVRAQPRDI